MRRKHLLTSVLCAALLLASCAVSNYSDSSILKNRTRQTVYAAETSAEETQKAAEAAKTTKTAEASTASEAAKTSDTTASNTAKASDTTGSGTSKTSDTTVSDTTKTSDTTTTETTKPTENTQSTEATKPTENTQPTETTKPTENTQPSETTAPETTAPETTKPTEGTSGTEQLPTETTPGTEQTSTEGTAGTEQLPSETDPGTEQTPTEGMTGTEQLPSETTPGTETGSSEMSESESSSETEKATETETEEESESETSKYSSNEELLAHQNIVIPPDITMEFRFTQVDKRYAVVSNREGTQIYEEKSEDAKEVGTLAYYGSCYILEDAEDDWFYVESGNVRGFIKAEDVVTDEVAERIFKLKGEEELPTARLLVARSENEAFEYTHTTTQEVLVEKCYAIADERTVIYEQRKESSREIGVLSDGALCYILADEEEDWVFVESGDARGFVEKDKLITGKKAESIVSDAGEKNMAKAEVLIEPADNKSCYYTLASTQKASQSARTREAMVNFALQFVGNPYVWGGTSLTGGADCSGFVQSVYAYFGYSLPRVADAQSVYGMQIPISSAEPGDLIFYARNGYVYHVSMYIGNGQVVHAAGRKVGIITSGIGSNAVWATRVITD